eukprot:Opistho-1_new@933
MPIPPTLGTERAWNFCGPLRSGSAENRACVRFERTTSRVRMADTASAQRNRSIEAVYRARSAGRREAHRYSETAVPPHHCHHASHHARRARRRLRHAALAAQPSALPEAVPGPVRHVDAAPAGLPAARGPGRRADDRRIAAGGRQRGAPLHVAGAVARDRQHPGDAAARADRPQHGPRTHPGGTGESCGPRRRQHPRGHPGRPDRDRRPGLHACTSAGRGRRGGRQPRHARHRARPPGDRLRLYPQRRRRHGPARQGLRREARSGHRRALPRRRRLRVEQRHVRIAGLRVARRNGSFPA